MMHEPQHAAALAIYIIAAEESGDALGAALVNALEARHGGALKFAGVGGHAMAAAGIVSPFAIDELAIIGLAAIPRRLPIIFRRIRETADAVVAARPDALVIIDSPDFTHRVARRVRRRAPAIPILDYVSPSVWAWRPGPRARHARLCRSGAGHPAVRAGGACRARRSALHLCRPSADRAPCRTAPQCRGGAAPARRSAGRAGPAGQPVRARSAICSAFSAPRSRALPRARPDGARAADRSPSRGASARGRRRLDDRAAHRGRAGREMGGLSHGARRAGGIRHGDARTRARRRADRCRLPAVAVEAIVVRLLRLRSGCRASSSPIWSSARTSFRNSCRRDCTPESLAEALAAASLRYAAAAAPDRGLRPARCHHGDRRRGAERQGGGRSCSTWPARPARSGGAECGVTAVLTAAGCRPTIARASC